MTAHPRPWECVGAERLRHPLDGLDPGTLGRSLMVYRPDLPAIGRLLEIAGRTLSGLASIDVVARILKKNSDVVWAIARRSGPSDAPLTPEGFIATLPVTQLGLDQLLANTFAGANPDLAAVAATGERPAAIYIWAVYAPGRLVAAVPLAVEEMSKPPYRDADFIGRPTTSDGVRLNETCGFKRGVRINGIRADHLYVFQRSHLAETNAPIYDSYRAGLGNRTLSVTLARTADDLARVVAVRAMVYMAEQGCAFREEFDGNDLTAASHLIGYVGDEPGGCLRVRYFADFAKFERMAVLPRFRHTRLAFHLARAATALCQKKGYRTLYGHARKELVNFWKRQGFRQIPGRPEFTFSDQRYVEMRAEIAPGPGALSLDADPFVLIRPEGRWHVPGVLERTVNGSVAASRMV